ncbi:BV-e31 [Euproctis pseudoconspersa nucleopolyhedrovirus]|uniref:BV-e31 n=1 Tax=Euproctis pseudoconspersa nucleopolyhedrovirus TaxID=307467 RepID=C3TWV3_9ABAC|nr:BV-e31 [Euproctis pseudoconspersa nucleopolyhedrovirus]ACO53495.1 BV-e31 [Euproctis pseudoconspersa nucleopolyhedrovirus]
MRCAGLFMITEEPDNKAILLCARQSYDKSARYHNHEALQRAIFLEKISIPRGKRDGHDYFDYETAVREFIEETATFFDSAIVYKTPFVLQWSDKGANYKYFIYVGILRGLLKNVAREPNTFCVKLTQQRRINDYKIGIEARRFNNEISRHLYIVPLADYFKYMSEKQLITYAYSNYLDFFNFVRNVKSKFDNGRLLDFFLISLQLEKFNLNVETPNESFAGETTAENDDEKKWTASRRAQIVSAMRREILNLKNAPPLCV